MKQLSWNLNTEQHEWLLLISACLIKLIAGQTMAGAVYANYMKTSYELNQRQLDLCMALLYLGTLLIGVSGFFYDRCGARASVLVSSVFTTLTTALLAVAMANPAALRTNLWLLYILLFLQGHSFNYSFVAAVACCMASFQSSRRGYIMCLLDSSFSLGAPIVALIYYVVFDNTHRSQSAQNPVGTLVVMTLFTAAVHLFAYFFLVPPDGPAALGEFSEATPILHAKGAAESATSSSDDDQETFSSTEDESSDAAARPRGNGGGAGSGDGFKAQTQEFLASCVCSRRFSPLLLGFALVFAPNLVAFLNVTSLTRSLNLSQYDVFFFWFPNLAGIASRCLIGPLTDRYYQLAYQRSAALLICVAGFGTPAALMLSSPIASGASPFAVTMIAYILAAVSASAMFTLLPVIISQTEARHLFGRLYSACLVTGSLLSLPLMLQFGAFYDSHSVAIMVPQTIGSHSNNASGIAGNSTVSQIVEYVCTGQSCYVYGGVANTICHLLGLGCLTYYTVSLKLTSS